MATAHVERVTDAGNDRLFVTGTVDGVNGEDGSPLIIQATGWVSAMTNHFDAEAHYTESDIEVAADSGALTAGDGPVPRPGDRKPDAKPRPMDDDERMAYWEGLLLESAPTPEPDVTVIYQAPEA